MRTFIVDDKEINIDETLIKYYHPIYDDCFYIDGGREIKYDGELYFTEEGELLDRKDNTKIVPEVLTDEDGEVIKFNKDFFALDCTEGFILNKTLYLTSELEEIF